MVFWKQYLLSILICSLICGLVSQMIGQKQNQKMMHLICGILVALSILTPLTKVNLQEFLPIPDCDWNAADFYTSEGEKIASAEKEKYIQAYCEAYILDKARSLGVEMTVRIALNETMVPVCAEIQCDGDIAVQTQLQKIIATDLGIPKENQIWIWNRENSNS